MKLIFLDIDGVLNYYGCENALSDTTNFVEDEKIELLKRIVDQTGAYLVLSSSWRFGWRDLEVGHPSSIFVNNYFKLRDKFHEYGMAFFSRTPILAGFPREMEIQYWISNQENETIESFVILDDEDYEFDVLKKYLIKTKYNEGLNEEHVEKAIQILEQRY